MADTLQKTIEIPVNHSVSGRNKWELNYMPDNEDLIKI